MADFESLSKLQLIDSEGPYRLSYCSSKGDRAGVLHELEKGVEPNLANHDKRTALHLACCEGQAEIVLLLLEKGAHVNALDRWGRTPLSDARSFGHLEICKILEAHGGIDPMQLDCQSPCYEIDQTEVDMDKAIFIGHGVYNDVYLVKWRGTEVEAITIGPSLALDPRIKNSFIKKLYLWQTLRHPNIVQFLGVLKHSENLIFLTEYLRDGSFCDILKKKGSLDPPIAVSYALDIARGMNYLHRLKPHGIIHRNLTPSIVLRDEAGHLKITAFGLSKTPQKKILHDFITYGGPGDSYHYTAPEVYRGESYGKSVDVFSFGIIVYEMFHGGPTTKECGYKIAHRQAYEDYRPPLSSSLCPESIKALLRDCWHKNPDCRPTFSSIISQLEIIEESLLNEAPSTCCWGI